MTGDDQLPPAALASPLLAEALAYWEGKCPAHGLPSYTSVDPLEMPRLLANLIVYEVLRDPLDFRVRLVGDKVRSRMGSNPRGLLVSEMDQQGVDSRVFAHNRDVVESAAPCSAKIQYVGPDLGVRECIGITLPFAEDAKTVDRLITVVEFRRRPRPTAG